MPCYQLAGIIKIVFSCCVSGFAGIVRIAAKRRSVILHTVMVRIFFNDTISVTICNPNVLVFFSVSGLQRIMYSTFRCFLSVIFVMLYYLYHVYSITKQYAKSYWNHVYIIGVRLMSAMGFSKREKKCFACCSQIDACPSTPCYHHHHTPFFCFLHCLSLIQSCCIAT